MLYVISFTYVLPVLWKAATPERDIDKILEFGRDGDLLPQKGKAK